MKRVNWFGLAFTLATFACGGPTSGTVIANPATPSSPARVMSLNISGAPDPPAATFQLTANAALSDGTTQDVTRAAAWGTSDAQVAVVTSTGRVTVNRSGEVDVRAVFQGVTATDHVIVGLPTTFTLNGIVSENAPNGSRVAGARVQIVTGPFAYTDDLGWFTLRGVPSGRAIIEVTKDGYQIWSNEIVIDHDNEVLAVVLHPMCPGPHCTSTCPGPQCT
jgi:hypothetical protein